MTLFKLGRRFLGGTVCLLFAAGLALSAAAEDATSKSGSPDSASPASGSPEVGAGDTGSGDHDMSMKEMDDNFVDDAEQLGDKIAGGAEDAYDATKKAIEEAFE